MTLTSLVWRRPSNGLLRILPKAYNKMLKYRQLNDSTNEAGGIIVGRFLLESCDIVVDDVSVPTKQDFRSRFRFFRSKRIHQLFARSAWTKSDSTCNYLGEWHTHPESDPSPSKLDISNWRERLFHDYHNSDELFFLILGTTKIGIWEGSKSSNTFVKLLFRGRT